MPKNAVPLKTPSLFLIAYLLLLITAAPQMVVAQTGLRISHGDDFADILKAEGDKSLVGRYDGTTYSIVLEPQSNGVTWYPEKLEFGASPRYVWIFSYYRYVGGICCMDVLTSSPAFAAWGRTPELSADREHVTYWVDGIYGLMYAVCVDNFTVYPYVRQTSEIMSRAVDAVEVGLSALPEMELAAPPKWVAKNAIAFAVVENVRVAGIEKDPDIQRLYLVKAEGVGEGATTNSIRVTRTRLPLTDFGEKLSAARRHEWDYQRLLQKYEKQMEAVDATNWPRPILDDPRWRIVPEDKNELRSPDGKHLLAWKGVREWTDTPSSAINVTLDGQPIILSGRENENEVTTIPQTLIIRPLARLAAVPRWQDNETAVLLIQSQFGHEAATGDKARTLNLRIIVNVKNNGGLIITKQELQRLDFDRLVDATRRN